jgi:hypothetical protein
MSCFFYSALLWFTLLIILFGVGIMIVQKEIRFNRRIYNLFGMLNIPFLWKIEKMLNHLYFWFSPKFITFKLSFFQIHKRDWKREPKKNFMPILIIPISQSMLCHYSICNHDYRFSEKRVHEIMIFFSALVKLNYFNLTPRMLKFFTKGIIVYNITIKFELRV